MFNLTPQALARVHELSVPDKKIDAPIIIEGADVFDVLCPVSKASGHRENPLSLLAKVLPPDKERLASLILQEIPAIQSENPKISDADAIEMCVSRFSSGSKFEDGQVREALFKAADLLFPGMSAEQKQEVVTTSAPESPDVQIEDV